jgi:hypothetical protein
VAKTATTSQQLGLTRGKAILIGVLAVALLGVIVVQYRRFSGGGAPQVAAPATPMRATKARAMRSDAAATKQPTSAPKPDGGTDAAFREFDQMKWKSPTLAEVIAYDPFALPGAFPQPPRFVGADDADTGEALTAEEQAQQIVDALAELRMQLEELKQRGVHVILGKDGQYVATIGDQRIQVGDDINGFTVTDIDPKSGVHVEWKEPE